MIVSRHYQRLISPPKGSFFLFGVRGVGKSTWARDQFPEAYLVDLLLGSSARRLKTASTNLLAGRATVRTMYPLAPAELGPDFDLQRVMRFGSIPLIWQADDPRAAKRQLGPVGAEERGPYLKGGFSPCCGRTTPPRPF